MTKYADISNYSEDRRIGLIGHRVMDHREIIGFIVEDYPKADRYIKKLLEKHPQIQVIDKKKFHGSVMVRVGPPGGQA